MTERVVYLKHPERAVIGGSCLCESYMKTIPELCVEGIDDKLILKRYRVAYVTGLRVKIKVEPCESTLRYRVNL